MTSYQVPVEPPSPSEPYERRPLYGASVHEWRPLRARPSRKVLVLGAGNSSFLSVIRSLGRRGLEVHAGGSPPDAPAARSRYVRVFHDLPDYGPGWVEAMAALLERERYDLVVPTNEQWLRPLQHHRSELAPRGPICLLEDRAFRVAFDKLASYEAARSLGLKLPRQLVARDPADAERILSELALPLVLKPRSSYSLGDLRTRGAVRKVSHADALRGALAHMLQSRELVIVQENFRGRGVGVELLAQRGEVRYAFQHERIHEPIRGGASSYRRSVPLNPELLDASARLLRALDWTGVAMIEFKVNPENGDWIFVEINGRFWGSLPLALAAGADFPYFLYQMLVEGVTLFDPGYQVGVRCRNWIADTLWMLELLRADRTDPAVSTLPWRTVLRDLVPALTLREHSDTFVRDDPSPAFLEVKDYARRISEHVLRRARVKTRALAPPLIRARRAAQARAALRSARSIVFVCKGNICRSPFAERLASATFPGNRRVASSGFFSVPGRRSPPQAVQAAAQLGIQLEQHRSAVLSAREAREADAVVVFDEDIYEHVAKEHPTAAHKIVRFADLTARGPTEVEDPYGGELGAFRACYALISSVLRDLAEEMT